MVDKLMTRLLTRARLRLCESRAAWHHAAMTGPSPLILSLLMIAVAVLAAGGAQLIIKRGDRLRAA